MGETIKKVIKTQKVVKQMQKIDRTKKACLKPKIAKRKQVEKPLLKTSTKKIGRMVSQAQNRGTNQTSKAQTPAFSHIEPRVHQQPVKPKAKTYALRHIKPRVHQNMVKKINAEYKKVMQVPDHAWSNRFTDSEVKLMSCK